MAKNTGIAQFSQGKQEVFKVDPALLVITDGWNTRDENDELLAHIDMLAQSIAEIGVRKPIEVKLEDGRLVVKDGHCRTRAAMRAISHYHCELKTVPVISVDRYANDADLILNQVISNSGKALTTIEEAKVYKKLIDLGWKQSDIAKKVGKSSGRISQIMGILVLPAVVQSAVTAGTISASAALGATRLAETNGQSPQSIVDAIQTASSEGRKVRPGDLSAKPKFSLADVWESCEFDDENMDEEGFATIKMPREEYLLVLAHLQK